MLHSLGMPPQALQELTAKLESITALERGEATPHLQAILSDLFRGTWFRMDACAALTMTFRGSRPGDPAADMLFALSFCTCLLCIRDAHLPAGPQARIRPAQYGEAPESISFVDRVTGRSHDLPVVAAYKHLGTVASAEGSPALEIRYRRALALGAALPLRYKFYGNQRFPKCTRATLLRALAVSRLMHGCGGLNLQAVCHPKKWWRAYVSLWRCLLPRQWHEARQPHAYSVLAYAEVPTPPLALAAARAALFSRLLRQGPAVTVHLLQAHWELAPMTSWLGQLVADVAYVRAYVPASAVLADVPCAVSALADSVFDTPSWWQRCVKQACRLSVQDLRHWRQVTDDGRLARPPARAALRVDSVVCLLS